MRNVIISLKFIPQISNNMAAIHKKGPKGIILSLLLNNMIKAIGNAIKVAKNIVQIDIEYPKTKPKTNNSFMSPPPKDSFLNILSPIILIVYIVKNDKAP